MSKRKSKLCSMRQAVSLVRDGDRIALGGFAIYQKPMALVHELIRSQKRELTVVGSVNSIDVDMLAGAGCLKGVETSYVGLEKFGLAANYRRAVQAGEIRVVHYPELISWDRFRANAEGLSFWPVSYLGGSDIVNLNQDIQTFLDPITGKTLYAVPAANPDVAAIHVPAADIYGNVRIQPRHLLPQSMDVAIARATRNLIVTAEKIIATEEIQKTPHLNVIPAFRVRAVVHAPNGSHPTPVLGVRKMDDAFFEKYVEASADPQAFHTFLQTLILQTRDQSAYLKQIGYEQIGALTEEKEGKDGIQHSGIVGGEFGPYN